MKLKDWGRERVSWVTSERIGRGVFGGILRFAVLGFEGVREFGDGVFGEVLPDEEIGHG